MLSMTAPELRKPELQLFQGLIPGDILYCISCLPLCNTAKLTALTPAQHRNKCENGGMQILRTLFLRCPIAIHFAPAYE